MKIKKRFLSSLLCAAILIGLVSTTTFAAKEWVPGPETDGAGEYYEYNVNASDITPDTTGGNPVYNFKVPGFNDVGDIIAIKFKDVGIKDAIYSSYIRSSDIDIKHGVEDYEYLKSMIDGGHPGAADLTVNLANGYENYISLFMFLYNESDSTDLSYTLKVNNKLYKVEDGSLVETSTPAAYMEAISWNIASHNAIFGTRLPEKMYDDTTTIEASQIQLNKIDFQLYYKGKLIETYNLADIIANPIEYNTTFMYTITYKLNADGTVTATAPISHLIHSEAKIQYKANAEYTTWQNKTSNGTDSIYNFTDAITAENIRVTSFSVNGHKLQTTLNVTNISTILEYYKTSGINPEDVTDADKPEDDNENSGDPMIKPAPDYDITPPGKEDETPVDDAEDETPADDSEGETTAPDAEDEPTKSKEVELTEDNMSVSKDDMATLITENATKDVVIKTPVGITLTFAKGTMKAVDGKDTYDFGVSMSDDYSKHSDMGVVTKDNFVSLIDFNYSGNLPAEATVKIPVGTDRAGQTLYYSQKVEAGYTLIQSVKVDNEGYITVKQDHCSTYVITTADINKDASSDVNEESSSDVQEEPGKTPDSNNVIIYVIIAVAIAAIAGAAVFMVYKKKKTEKQDN